jgi:hypothetical protein
MEIINLFDKVDTIDMQGDRKGFDRVEAAYEEETNGEGDSNKHGEKGIT